MTIEQILLLCLLAAVLIVLYVKLAQHRRKRHKEMLALRLRARAKILAEGAGAVTPEDFLSLREASFGSPDMPLGDEEQDFRGVYVLYNVDKNKYYVGQGMRVLSRINGHFTGRGNGDVYADYKYGDHFTIKVIPLAGSGCDSLNQLERLTIEEYDAFAGGYNKTRGNRD